MVKLFSAVILLFLLLPVNLSFAQEDPGGVKTYSGHFHHSINLKSQKGLLQVKKDHDDQCFVEFHSPASFSHQLVIDVPKELTYFIKFKNSDGKSSLEKFIIKIYTNNDQEYSIDPDAEGAQVGINDEHHIYDPYLIYLILGQQITHVEVVSASGGNQDKYVLDTVEIHNNN